MRNALRLALCLTALLLPSLASAQTPLSEISFDSVPGATRMSTESTAPILMDSDTEVSGSVSATGLVSTDSGVEFPDGSVQVTAAQGAAAGAGGLYSNTIADFTPPNAYTEICVKSGEVLFDIHSAGEATAGGDCLPGDIGWVIERFERDGGVPAFWAPARLACLKDGMRFPDPFEWQIACEDASLFAVNDMEDNWEWASSDTDLLITSSGSRIVVAGLGSGSCMRGGTVEIARSANAVSPRVYRCVR